MSLRERLRIEIVTQRLGWWLDWKCMPGRRRRAILREVRANLADAAADGELTAAINRLGDLRATADDFLEGERGVRLRWGLVAAVSGYGLVTLIMMFVAMGFTEGVLAVGPEQGQVYETGHSLTIGPRPLMEFAESAEGLSFAVSIIAWPHVIVAVLAFFGFWRPWTRTPRTQPAGQST